MPMRVRDTATIYAALFSSLTALVYLKPALANPEPPYYLVKERKSVSTLLKCAGEVKLDKEAEISKNDVENPFFVSIDESVRMTGQKPIVLFKIDSRLGSFTVTNVKVLPPDKITDASDENRWLIGTERVSDSSVTAEFIDLDRRLGRIHAFDMWIKPSLYTLTVNGACEKLDGNRRF